MIFCDYIRAILYCVRLFLSFLLYFSILALHWSVKIKCDFVLVRKLYVSICRNSLQVIKFLVLTIIIKENPGNNILKI